MPQRPALAALPALALLGTALALGGCGSSDSASSAANAPVAGSSVDAKGSAAGGSVDARGPAAGPASEGGAKGTGSTTGLTTPVAVSPAGQKRTRSAQLAVTVKDILAAAAKVRAVATESGGIVTAESLGGATTDADRPGRNISTYGRIEISVPADRLDAALERLSTLGTVVSRTTEAQDVTAAYVDTESRLATMKTSVARVRALMAKASTIGEIVALEAEVTRREADLEALQSQLDSLKTRVALSPVSIELGTESAELTPAPGDGGFLAGLAAGWRAFTTSMVALLTFLGAVLPFLAAAALVGVPLALWARRRARARGTFVGAAPPPVAYAVAAAGPPPAEGSAG